ncbi:MAG TPA: aminotransferase class IV [Candidatus Paceibacterota bacterium]|nr:aminotransferase class IV [Candidatus Paceibacterota bacterium]
MTEDKHFKKQVTPAPTQEPVLIMIKATLGMGSLEPLFERLVPTDPHINVLDLGITRGDGIFESIGVINGTALELEPHLTRLCHSAIMLNLPELNLDAIRAAVLAAIDAHTPVPELLVKVFVTRGIEGTNVPSAWIYATQTPDYYLERTEGIRTITLDRGYRHDVTLTSPWLLQGAKTLSYAVNLAALREAKRRGASDAIFLSSDGFALEGSTSSLIIRNDTGFHTPRLDLGVLAGTTQAAVFRVLESAGFTTQYSLITSIELREAINIWLVSSGRLVVPVNNLDGVDIRVDRELTAQVLRNITGESL